MTDTTMTLGAARADYYRANGFGDDGGDSLEWVPIKVLGLTLKIPNTDGRRRAVRIHDLHHVVTGYQTDLRGEAEIGAWELASGCLRWPAATVLNLFALAIGIVIAPRRVARAWARGRRTGKRTARTASSTCCRARSARCAPGSASIARRRTRTRACATCSRYSRSACRCSR